MDKHVARIRFGTPTDAADLVVRYAMNNEVCPLVDAQRCRDTFEAMREALAGLTNRPSDDGVGCFCVAKPRAVHSGRCDQARAALARANKVSA